jgi:hypothetical protein
VIGSPPPRSSPSPPPGPESRQIVQDRRRWP